MLLRRAAAAFRRTKPSGRTEARSFGRTVPVMCFHRRMRRRCMCLAAVRESLGRGLLQKAEYGQSGVGGSGNGNRWWDLPRSFVIRWGKGRYVVSDKWASHLSWVCGM